MANASGAALTVMGGAVTGGSVTAAAAAGGAVDRHRGSVTIMTKVAKMAVASQNIGLSRRRSDLGAW